MAGNSKTKVGKMQKAVLSRTIIPMILMGIFVAITVFIGYKNTVKKEVLNSLETVASSVAISYDEMFPGEYSVVGKKKYTLYKGTEDITGDYQFLDKIKEANDVELSIAIGNVRMLSTLKNDYNERATSTPVNASVVSSAEKSPNIIISEAYNGKEKYYACYYPIYNSNNVYVGLYEVLKPIKEVDAMAAKAALPVIAVTIVCLILVMIMIFKYTKNLINAMSKICDFLQGMISGDLNNDMPKSVLDRNDELGKTGKTVVNMQYAIRILVEKDALTGLYNRRYGNAKLRKIQKYAEKSGMPYAVAIGDIDFFKKVNDTYGHEAGDIVLKRVAEIMNKGMTGKGFVARWGGEEFLLAFDKTGKDGAAKELNKILATIRKMVIVYNDMTIRVTMSFGVVDGSTSNDFGTLLRTADDKLYYAKEHGRNQVVSIELDEVQKEAEADGEEAEEEEVVEPTVVEGTNFEAVIDNGNLDNIVKMLTENIIDGEE